MLRADALVKVVDFGIARVTQSYEGSLLAQTASGAIMGTPRYMSPEQARGQSLDERTDVFSLATVLYEMLTGEPRFPGETPAEIFDSLLSSASQLYSTAFDSLPSEIKPVLVRALEKNCDRRYQTMREFQQDLSVVRQQLLAAESGGTPKRSRLVLLLAACTVAVSAIAAGWFIIRTSVAPVQILTPLPFTTEPGYEYEPRISPDGNRITICGRRRLITDSARWGSVSVRISRPSCSRVAATRSSDVGSSSTATSNTSDADTDSAGLGFFGGYFRHVCVGGKAGIDPLLPESFSGVLRQTGADDHIVFLTIAFARKYGAGALGNPLNRHSVSRSATSHNYKHCQN